MRQTRVSPLLVAGFAGVLLMVSADRALSLERFIRGDVTQDGRVQVNDAVGILENVFLGRKLRCLEAGNLSLYWVSVPRLQTRDAILLLQFLFAGGPPPELPFPECGASDTLRCDRFDPCDPAPPNTFFFYRTLFEADNIVYLIDRSEPTRNGELARAKEDVLTRLPFLFPYPFTRVSVVFYGGRGEVVEYGPVSIETFELLPLAAFLDSVGPQMSPENCPEEGFEAAIRLAADQAEFPGTPQDRVILFMHTVEGECAIDEAMIDRITAANDGTAEIHTIWVGPVISEVPGKETLLRSLAERNGGTFTRVPR